jgi:hypothetical protein
MRLLSSTQRCVVEGSPRHEMSMAAEEEFTIPLAAGHPNGGYVVGEWCRLAFGETAGGL